MRNIEDNMELLKSIMTLLQNHFGEKCEIVLHDFNQNPEHSIVDIRNGHITNREIGGCATNIGLEILSGFTNAKDTFNNITYTDDGKILRSSSVCLKDKAGKTVGSLCLNLDITDTVYFEKHLRDYNQFQSEGTNNSSSEEFFTPNVHELLDKLIEQCVSKFGKPPKSLSKEEKMQLISELDEKGTFIITKSSDRVFSLLGISRYTFYNYLDAVRKQRSASDKKSND